MTVVVLSIAVIGFGLVGWHLVAARRRRENQRAMTPSWLVEHAYEKEGDKNR